MITPSATQLSSQGREFFWCEICEAYHRDYCKASCAEQLQAKRFQRLEGQLSEVMALLKELQKASGDE